MISEHDIYIGIMTPNEIRSYLGIAPVDVLDDQNRITNCKNCGAPLPKNGCCEYCRTQY